MVPKVAGKGTSFKGAGLYYLHDKNALTANRVAFTLTENLPTDDPALALRYMAYTAMRQAELKAASGAARTGRKLALTVYTYSLSWAPDEQPTPQEMIEAGRATLQVLGLERHEVLMVAHNDEPHPHLHLIVNRVHPETGLAAKLSNDHLDLSKWAEAYEREQGQIRCEERVKNNEERRRRKENGLNGFVKHRQKTNAADFHRWRKDRLKAAFAVRQAEEKNLSAYHQGQREALFDEKELRIEHRRAEIRERFRPDWAALYRRQAQEKRELRRAQGRAFSRLMYWIRHRKQLPSRGLLRGALEAVLGRRDFAAAVRDRHEAARKALARKAAEANRAAIREENARFRGELDSLKRIQAGEMTSLKETHTRQSQDFAREIREGRDVERYAKETGLPREEAVTLAEEFRRRVAKRIRKARKRREERGKGHGRERDS